MTTPLEVSRATRGAGAAAAAGWFRAMRPLAVLALALTAACDRVDRLLSIETPSRLAEENLIQPANAALMVASAAGDLQCALGAYAAASGLAAGELFDATQTASRWGYDRRGVLATDAHYSTFGCEAIGVYTPLSTARYTNDQALSSLEGWTDQQVPNRTLLIAQAAAFAGYSALLIGEGFCSAAIGGGPELTSQQLFEVAEDRFTRAIAAAQAANSANLLNLAYVGRARARLNRGNTAGAAADAALVPVSFVFAFTSTTVAGRYNNRLAQQNVTTNNVTVAPAYRNLTVQESPDPRVPVLNTATVAPDQVNTISRQQKFPALTSDMPLATGVEAALIRAEALGAGAGVPIINALRARAGVNLPPLTAEEEANFTATLFEERRRELWLQGNRWYDLRRGNLALVPATGATYPKGGTYGDQRCWPLPDVERLANPNIPG